ncbi:MAG: FAD-dependent oxidoreductase, partial [Alphaproteobacteria bacterium]|nr:FAD-dependent oxidoreductase [Alphaproteobacteria bacterium]
MSKNSVLSRRRFISAAGSALVAPSISPSFAALPSNPEIVIIGAGVAGLSAARTLRANGVDCVILEARDRIGGRAYTDSSIFGIPYDLGAAWLHSADENPLTNLVMEAGFDVVDEQATDTWLYLDGREASDDQYESLERAMEKLDESINDKIDAAIDDIGHFKDRSVFDLSPIENRFDRIAHEVLGPLEAGADTNILSAMDVYSQRATGVE